MAVDPDRLPNRSGETRRAAFLVMMTWTRTPFFWNPRRTSQAL
jgi:hypothetical protein